MTTLNIKNLGQIKEANLIFGDLTVLVGPQATGKSIALQLLKLMVDAGQVQDEMSRYGLDWEHKLPEFLDVYFGEGMRSIWKEGSTSVEWEGKPVDLPQLARRSAPTRKRRSFSFPRSAYWLCEMAGLDPLQTTHQATRLPSVNSARNCGCWWNRSLARVATCSHRSVV